MKFNIIDMTTWKRREYFDHYLNNIPCTYSMTLNLDITTLLKAIKQKGVKLYPASIYLIAAVVNRHEEFRTSMDSKGNVGVFDRIHPAYTILHKESDGFTNIWTEYGHSFSKFYNSYLSDVEKYSKVNQFIAKPDAPINLFTISSIPWVSFTGFNLNLPKGNNYLLPIFTTGKFFEQNDRIWLPISIQAHHAVCDGYHLARFINELQEEIYQFQCEL